MAVKKTATKKVAKKDDKTVELAKKPEAPKAKAEIVNDSGTILRVYSEEVHGKDYLDLAKQFVAKRGGRIK